jgi:hypothetical protein
MSEQRRPTVRLGKKRDPRVESVPPSSRKAGPDSVPPSNRKPERRDSSRGLEVRTHAELDAELATERSDAGGDMDEVLGRLLARATQAELRAQQLEQTLARLNEERIVLESRLSEVVRQLDDADTSRASLEAQVRTMGQARRTEGPVTLAYVRSMAAELVRALDRVTLARPAVSDLPTPRPPSDLPTPRPQSLTPTPRARGSDRPRR